MYIHAKGNPWKAAMFYVWDLDTNEILHRVLWANDDTGEYTQYAIDEFDEIIYDENDEPFLEIKKGNIKLKEK